MRLHFPDLSIFVAAIQANSTLATTVQLVVIADVEYEVCTLLASSQYASALAAFFATSSHEQQSAHQHAQRIIAEARVSALIATNTAITQAAEVPSRPATRRPPGQVTAEEIAEYCQKRVQTQQQRAELQAKALALLATGSSVVDVAVALNLSQTTVGRWRRENPSRARYTPYGAPRQPAATRPHPIRYLEYDPEKKADALGLLANGASVSEVAAQMKISAQTLRRWLKEQKQAAGASTSTPASTQTEQPQLPSPPSTTPETTITIDLTVEETSPASPEAPVTVPEQPAATPPPSPPSSPSSWLDDEGLLDWIVDNSTSTSAQAPAPQLSPSPQPQDSDNQADMNDQEFIAWLLSDDSQVMPQSQPQSQPQAPPPLPSVPLPLSQAGLVRVQIEELRVIITSSSPRVHGILADHWVPDAVKLFILQRYQKLLSLAQVQELLDIHIFHSK